MDNKVMLREIDMMDANLGTVTEVEVETTDSLTVYSGYDRGILISDSSSLWEYDLTAKTLTLLLEWGAEHVQLNGYNIVLIGMPKDGRLYVMATRQSGADMQLVYIESVKASEIAQKQTVIVGTYELLMLLTENIRNMKLK